MRQQLTVPFYCNTAVAREVYGPTNSYDLHACVLALETDSKKHPKSQPLFVFGCVADQE